MRKSALILAPHPDDESITGLLPLRLQEECGFKVWVVPFTLGSQKDRQLARREELQSACKMLGFKWRFLKTWGDSVNRPKELCDLYAALSPSVVFIPHAEDGHPTHRATHRLGVVAMDAARGSVFQVVETEYWHPLKHPNLMVAASAGQLGQLCRALACHKGELARNDYAARLPAWMIDNVRRGAELVGGVGSAAPNLPYATLYRVRRRMGGAWKAPFYGGRMIVTSEDLKKIEGLWP